MLKKQRLKVIKQKFLKEIYSGKPVADDLVPILIPWNKRTFLNRSGEEKNFTELYCQEPIDPFELNEGQLILRDRKSNQLKMAI